MTDNTERGQSELVEVLRTHEMHVGSGGNLWNAKCLGCSWADSGRGVMTHAIGSHRGHLAEVLQAHVDAKVAAALEGAAALHAPIRMHPEFRFQPWCAECSQGFHAPDGDGGGPSERRVTWPCRTAKVLGLIDPLQP